MIENYKKVVVISPHPDDETLGVGGTICRLCKAGAEINVLVVSGHLPPLYSQRDFKKTYEEAMKAFNLLKVKNYKFLKLPATFLHKEDISNLYKKISDFICKYNPDLVFLPFPDRHIDHRIIFDGGVVACRPKGKKFPKTVLLYETLSETHWNVPGVEASFNPDFFVDISNELNVKLDALKCYQSQIQNNLSRSIQACESLAKFRGSQNGCEYAEAFKVVRIVI